MAARKKIRLDVVTPEEKVYSEDINVLEATAIDGLIGILPNHAPLVTSLKIGYLKIIKKDEEFEIAISEGFMEVQPDQINVVVRTAELPHEIDLSRAEKAKKRAEERLEAKSDRVDYMRAEAALKRAISRIKVARNQDRSY